MYMSFFQDWGPLNVAMVYKACIFIHTLLTVSDLLLYEMQLPVLCDVRTKVRDTEQSVLHTLHPKPAPISSCPRMFGEPDSTTSCPFMMFIPHSRTRTLPLTA